MNKIYSRKILICLLITLYCLNTKAQDQIIRENGHFAANLDFIPSSGIYKQRNNRLNIPFFTPYFPQEFTDNDITVKDMVNGAILSMDWWTLFGEPVENYNFQWTSSGRYYISEYGGRLNITITRNMVAKYPDLLMRFDALKPLDVKFVINWKHNSEAYKKSLKYGFSTINGNESVSTNVTTGLLFEPSGKEPFSVPRIRKGKGLEFIDKKISRGESFNINEENKKIWLDEFNKAERIVIDKFYVTDIKWPVSEMKAIAELYEKYENGELEPTPLQQINEEVKKNENLTAYNKNDFFGDAFISEVKNIEIFKNASTIGIKKSGRITYQEIRENVDYVRKFIDNTCPWYYVTFKNNEKFKNYLPSPRADYKPKHKIINDEGQLQTVGGYSQFDLGDVLENKKTAIYIYLEEYKRISDRGLSWVLYNDKIGGFSSFDEAEARINRSLGGNGDPIGVGKYKRLTIDENLNVLENTTVFKVMFEVK